jgi:NADH:ubiquinone oxidoreductase subunit 3 (subunit A)
MDLNIILSPPVAFLIFTGAGFCIYFLGRLMGARLKKEHGKLEPYACGENFKAEKFSFGYRRFFIAALFFTVMHVAALTIATMPGGTIAFSALVYLCVIGLSVSILYLDFD